MKDNKQLFEGLKSGKYQLYEIWESDGNDRSHYGNVISNDYEKVESWLIQHFIKEEYREMVEIDEMGISIISCDKEECWENLSDENKKEYYDNDINNICDLCGSCQVLYFSAELIEQPDLSDLNYNTIFGTNEFYDLTGDIIEKKENTNKTLFNAWNISPEMGISALIMSDYTPKLAIDKEYLEKCKKDLEEAGLI